MSASGDHSSSHHNHTPPLLTLCRISLHGVVQGVGFRPFIFRLAQTHGLKGYVMNTPAGVEIEVEGQGGEIFDFCEDIMRLQPQPARIDHLAVLQQSESATPRHQEFHIKTSSSAGLLQVLPPPDLDVCAACRAELFAPADRRFLYPFINCTACGPRYSLIENLPYDRAMTAMKEFSMCPACEAEYHDPASRRFHAEATCCQECGPRLTLTDQHGNELPQEPISCVISRLQEGKIVAIKGIGGFHLAVDGANLEAVARLRRLKGRPDKPLAVMAPDLATVRKFAEICPEAETALESSQKPIVLLPKREPFPLAENLAPGNRFIGVMLPYTPVHHLLLRPGNFTALVMTSGNLSGEPILTTNSRAQKKLAHIADFFLLHNRPIITGADDSLIRPEHDQVLFLRRARSFAPLPLALPLDCGATLALGGNLKNTFCLTRGQEAFLSQHLGDLEHLESRNNFLQVLERLQHLLAIKPELIVHDLHPDSYSSRYALTCTETPTVAVQHHHAHAVSCMVENGLQGRVIGLTLDGSGYGTDDTLWGGEILVVAYDRFQRAASLAPVPMPGGEQAIRQPFRMGLSYLFHAYGRECAGLDLEIIRRHCPELPLLLQMMEKKINAPLTSSCGRLFDGVAALLGVREISSFEGQAAMELEMICAEGEEAPYPYGIVTGEAGMLRLEIAPIIRALVDDICAGQEKRVISARFHQTLAVMFTEACCRVGRQEGLKQVVLSGGVFQNVVLTSMLSKHLNQHGFTVFKHRQLPPNDGGLALGQAVAGRAIFNSTQYRHPAL